MIVHVRCCPEAIVPLQSPEKDGVKLAVSNPDSRTLKLPGLIVTD